MSLSKEWYEGELKKLREEAQAKEYALMKQFALANNPYKVGDLFTDHIGTIRIQQIYIYRSFSEPQCVYIGENLTKAGAVNKREPKRTAYQSNDIKNESTKQ